jgi:hypothetical protein
VYFSSHLAPVLTFLAILHFSCYFSNREKEAAGWAEVGPGRPAQPTSRPSQPPFNLAASRAIYSPLTENHGRIHSSSAAEEQRSLRDTISERRVVLVV